MHPANLYLMNRPDLISTFTKIELWKQTQYKRIVYLDADMVVLRAPNELLTMDTNFAAVPDVGWPDCFNSGVMVLNPNMGDYYALLALARRGISFDGADQGLLNMHFADWERLSFAYNCTPNANYQYVPAFRHFQSTISMIHFIGAEKPWRQGRDHSTRSDVYGELLARWWAVYDRHYRRPVISNGYYQPQKKVQDYVRGEETKYEPVQERRASSGYQITQPKPQTAPGIHPYAPPEDSAAMERPFGDQPTLDERIGQNTYHPTPTQEQRRFSAPYADWEPTRQPPPPGSKPEAVNFPSQQYEMSESNQLFEPPSQYPEPPKDMWYDVPQTKPEPTAAPKAIFPWEERAPKATRVFPKSREATPPSETRTPSEGGTPTTSSNAQERARQESIASTVSQALSQSSQAPRAPSPSQHIFPWEARAPKPTRVFPQDKAPSPPPPTRSVTVDGYSDPSITGQDTAASQTAQPAKRLPDNPWVAFAQQSNTWDEDPDIARFMESFNKPRRAPVQVVHDSRPPATSGDTTLPIRERRASLKLTDFPTEIERPSLPVTPAPIRRSTIWGSEQGDEGKDGLAVAQGVPRQDEWVRRFTSHYLPALPNPLLRDIDGVLHLTCQHCNQQNPLIKLEELQRKQSLIMTGGEDPIEQSKTPPRREMPESNSAEEVVVAAMRAANLVQQKRTTPAKPILRQPHFEVTEAEDSQLGNESLVTTAHMTATGSKSPTRFNPIILEGEAASERGTPNTEGSLRPEGPSGVNIRQDSNHTTSSNETTTASHHHSRSFYDFSTASLSPTHERKSWNDPARDAIKKELEVTHADEDVISPTAVA